MIRHPAIQILLLVGIILAETTLIKGIGFFGVQPEIYLVCFIFLAYSQGSMKGVLIGFVTGLVIDFVSSSPLGLSSFALSLIGYILGSLRGKIFLDPIFMPIVLTVFVGITHVIISWFLVSIFQINTSSHAFSGQQLIQLAINALIAPICFGILRLIGAVPQHLREDG